MLLSFYRFVKITPPLIERSEFSMSNKKFIFLIATTISSVAIGTTVIYRKIDAFRHGICDRMQWYYKGTDGKFHDLI